MKRKVAIFGWGTLAIEITRFLIDKMGMGCEIIFCCPNQPNLKKDQWQPSFEKYLKENKIKLISSDKISNSSTVSFIKEQKLDFIFSLQFNKIFVKEILDAPRFGSINLHYSPLPKYRGVAAPTWAIINGEKEFGVTLHYMDPVVDTGDIIDQSVFNIERIENAGALYEMCMKKALALFKKNIDGIFDMRNKRVPQDNSQAIYYPRKSLDFGLKRIQWDKDTQSLTKWIKAFIFPPFQLPIFVWKEKEFEVVAVESDFTKKQDDESPGTVITRNGKIFKIATHDSYVNVETK